jgi:hypothetical protein
MDQRPRCTKYEIIAHRDFFAFLSKSDRKQEKERSLDKEERTGTAAG